MRLLFFNQPAAEAVLKALCWTFVHSLWQAVVVAILGGLVIATTEQKRAHLRYSLFLTLFGILLVAIGGTFIIELSHHFYIGRTAPAGLVPDSLVEKISTTSISNSESAQTVISSFVVFLNKHVSLIILCWFFLFVVKFLQLAYGLAYIGRLRKTAVVPAGEWANLVHTLSKRLGIKRAPQLLESSRVTIPLTFGFLRATILVPLSLLSSLPLNQVEAVLLHELAHIRRSDYLVNLIQNSAELIFFFNPALLWMSSLIRQEREACCDDIVLQHTGQKQVYFEALVSFQEYTLTHSSSALGIFSNKNYLLRRMQRMLSRKNQNLNSMEKTFLILGVIAISAFAFIDTPGQSRPPAQQKVTNAVTRPGAQLVNEGASLSERLVVLPESLQELQAGVSLPTPTNDTVPKPKTKTTRYSNVTTKSSDDGNTKTYEVEATDNEGKTYRLKKLNNELTEMEVDGKKLQAINEDLKEELAHFEKLEINTNHKELFEVQRKEHEKMREMMEVQKKEFSKHRDEFKKQHQQLQEVMIKNIDTVIKMELGSLVQKEMAIQKTNLVRNKIEAIENVKRYQGNNNEINSIINDLMKRGIITNSDVMSFSLSNKELTVNGKKGPSDLHQALKEKYIKKDGDYFSYSKSGGNTTTTVNKE